MLTRVYTVMWLVFATTVGILMFTGNFEGWTAYTFGTLSFGLVFFGMMFVLPFNITHVAAAKPVKENGRVTLQEIRESWEPTDAAMRTFKYH